jgi:hypothetical protein
VGSLENFSAGKNNVQRKEMYAQQKDTQITLNAYGPDAEPKAPPLDVRLARCGRCRKKSGGSGSSGGTIP